MDGSAAWELLHGMLLVSHGLALYRWGDESPVGGDDHGVYLGGENGPARRSRWTRGGRCPRIDRYHSVELGVMML